MSNTKTVKDSEIVTDGRCKATGKVAFRKAVAERRSSRWEPDERGPWSAYKCRFGEHWHVGHHRVTDMATDDPDNKLRASEPPSSTPETIKEKETI